MPSTNENQSSRKWTGRTRGGFFGYWVFHTIIRFVGLLPAYTLLVFVSAYFLFFSPKSLKASNNYRGRIGYGGSDFLSKMWGGYKHFFSYGITLIDRMAILQGFSDKYTIELEGDQELFKALEKGKGLVLTGAHCGNWEIAAQSLAKINVPVNVLIFEGEREKTQQFFETVAAENRVNFIGVGGQDGGTIEGMQALARGEVVAILGDRTLNANEKNTVRVPFLGKEALFPIGPHLMAALSSAPILHVFAMRTRLYHYRYFIYPAEELQLGNRSMRYEQLTQWATVLVKRIETLLKQYPLQWYNFYEVWDE